LKEGNLWDEPEEDGWARYWKTLGRKERAQRKDRNFQSYKMLTTLHDDERDYDDSKDRIIFRLNKTNSVREYAFKFTTSLPSSQLKT
jgi:hypothetical protein